MARRYPLRLHFRWLDMARYAPRVLLLHRDMIRITKVDRRPSQRDSMNTDFNPGDVVRHKSGGKDITTSGWKMRASPVLLKKLRFAVDSKARVFTRKQFQWRCWSSSIGGSSRAVSMHDVQSALDATIGFNSPSPTNQATQFFR